MIKNLHRVYIHMHGYTYTPELPYNTLHYNKKSDMKGSHQRNITSFIIKGTHHGYQRSYVVTLFWCKYTEMHAI